MQTLIFALRQIRYENPVKMKTDDKKKSGDINPELKTNHESAGGGPEKSEEKKRARLPPTLSDIVYVAIISAPAPGKDSNFEVLAISMSDYSVIRLKYSRKTKLIPGTVLDLRDFGDMTHYSIEDSVPLKSINKRVAGYIGTALKSAGEKHPIGLFKAQTMAEEGIKNLFVLLNMDDPKKLLKFSEELRKSSLGGTIAHKDVFGHFIRAFPVKENPPDIRQQEALISICGNNPEVILELIDGYLDFENEK